MGTQFDNTSGVKRPKEETPLTDKEAEEVIKCADSFKYFLRNYAYIQNPSKGAVLFNYRDYQERVMDAISNNQFVIGLLPRQSGKCLSFSSRVNIRNKKTGEILEIPIGEFYNMVKD